MSADAEHIATAKRMKADGHTGKDIAKYLGVSRGNAVPVPRDGGRFLIRRNHGAKPLPINAHSGIKRCLGVAR